MSVDVIGCLCVCVCDRKRSAEGRTRGYYSTWLAAFGFTEGEHTTTVKVGWIFIYIFASWHLVIFCNLVACGLIASETGCVPEEGGGFTYPWCLFCQRSRGEIDAAGWFTSWNPLLPLKSLKSSFLRGEPLFNTPLPVHYLLLYMCVKRKQESGLSSLLFLFLTPPSCLRIGQIL